MGDDDEQLHLFKEGLTTGLIKNIKRMYVFLSFASIVVNDIKNVHNMLFIETL